MIYDAYAYVQVKCMVKYTFYLPYNMCMSEEHATYPAIA